MIIYVPVYAVKHLLVTSRLIFITHLLILIQLLCVCRSSRCAVGQVCHYWRAVLHHQTVSYLAAKIEKQLVDEQQLRQLGWSPDDHDISCCSCIHIAFGLFSAETTFECQTVYEVESEKKFTFTTSKVLVGMRPPNQGKPRTRVKVLDRLQEEGQLRLLKNSRIRKVARVYSGGDLLVIVETDKKLSLNDSVVVSLWRTSTETWLQDIDVNSQALKCGIEQPTTAPFYQSR